MPKSCDTQGVPSPIEEAALDWLNKAFGKAPPCYPPGLEKEDGCSFLEDTEDLLPAKAPGSPLAGPSVLQKGRDLALIGLPPGLEICDGTLDSGPLSISTASGSPTKHILESDDGDSVSQESSVSPIESPSVASSRDRLVCHLASMFATTPPTEWERAAVNTTYSYQQECPAPHAYTDNGAWGYEGWYYDAASAYPAWHHDREPSSASKKFCAWCGGERKAHYVYCPHCSQKLE